MSTPEISYDYVKSLERLLRNAQIKLEGKYNWDSWNKLNTSITTEILMKDSQNQIDMIKHLSTSNIRFHYTTVFIISPYTKVLDYLVQSFYSHLDVATIKYTLKTDDILFTYKTNLVEKIVDKQQQEKKLQLKDININNNNNNLLLSNNSG